MFAPALVLRRTVPGCGFRPGHEFELVTLNEQIICSADHQEALQSHLVYILKVNTCASVSPENCRECLTFQTYFQVVLPSGVSYAEVGGASAVSKVCVFEVRGASHQTDAWLLMWEDRISVHPVIKDAKRTLMLELSEITSHRNLLFFLFAVQECNVLITSTLYSFSEKELSKNTITMVTADRCVCRTVLIGGAGQRCS